MKISKLAALSVLAAASLPVAAIAQDAPATDTATAPTATAPAAAGALAAGQTIYGPQGEEVATVVSVADGNAVIDTGTNKATLPASSFGTSEKGVTIAYGKDQLNAAIEAANSQASAGQAQPEGGQ